MLVLRKMTEEEFPEYKENAVANYAADLMRAGDLPEAETKKLAEDAFQTPLSEGVHSLDHYLFSIFESGTNTKVGSLWLGKRKTAARESAFIYDIYLFENFRGKGYGEMTMRLAEAEAIRLGLKSIGLHVFGHNQAAKRLYDKLGFHVTNLMMRKEL